MKIDFEGARLYVRPGSTDLRKGVAGLLAIIEFVVFLRKHLMPKQGKTGKNFCHGILKLHLIRFVVNGFNLWYY